MQFAYPTGVQGNVVNAGANELILPNYKQTWANIRKVASAPDAVKHLSFKTQRYKASRPPPVSSDFRRPWVSGPLTYYEKRRIP